MCTPLLSVAIPVYNRKSLVLEMLDSIQNQTFTNWQVVFVDDGSTDGVFESLNERAESDLRIKVIKRDREPKGAQTCRNMGFEHSIGKYIMFLDSDDLLPEYCFEQRIAYIEKHPELDFAVFPYISFQEKPGDWIKGPRGAVNINVDDVSCFVYHSLPFVVWNNIYKKQSLLKFNRFWDLSLLSLQDADFNLQSILSGMKYQYAENAKVDYFFRSGNVGIGERISKKICTKEHYASHIYFIQKQLKSLPKYWISNHMKEIKWCFIHKYLLGVDNYDSNYVLSLLELSKDYNCYKQLYCYFLLYHILRFKLHINKAIVRRLLFPKYCKQITLNSRLRFNKLQKFSI